MVVSTTQVEDWDESSSFLMEWPLSLASIDLISAEGRASTRYAKAQPRDIPAALLQSHDKVLPSPKLLPSEQQRGRAFLNPMLRSGQQVNAN